MGGLYFSLGETRGELFMSPFAANGPDATGSRETDCNLISHVVAFALRLRFAVASAEANGERRNLSSGVTFQRWARV